MRYSIEWKLEGTTYVEAHNLTAAQEDFIYKCDNIDGYLNRYQHPSGITMTIKEYEDEPVEIG